MPTKFVFVVLATVESCLMFFFFTNSNSKSKKISTLDFIIRTLKYEIKFHIFSYNVFAREGFKTCINPKCLFFQDFIIQTHSLHSKSNFDIRGVWIIKSKMLIFRQLTRKHEAAIFFFVDI